MVNSEQYTVHMAGTADKKRPAAAGLNGLCCGGVVALRQPVAVAFLPQREVGLHALIRPTLVIIHTELFQHY